MVDSRQDHAGMTPTRLRYFRNHNLIRVISVTAQGKVTVIKKPKGFYRRGPSKMEKSRRIFFPLIAIILIASFLLWLIPWVDNGGWPAFGPVGNSLPPNIQHVMPMDGEIMLEAYGFCVHYDYRIGSGMDEASQETPRYFFDGRNVTQHTYDIVSLEYPTQVEEPCYHRSEPISPGWHTAKVTYQDTSGNRYEYKWRFQIIEEE